MPLKKSPGESDSDSHCGSFNGIDLFDTKRDRLRYAAVLLSGVNYPFRNGNFNCLNV